MSQANRVGKQNARERVAAEKVRRQRAERRRKQMTIGAVVIGVVGLVAGVGIAVQASKHNSSPYLAPVGAVVDPQAKSDKATGIQIGSADAPVKMVIFEDFRCPVCQETETAVEPVYKKYVEAGKLQVTYHPARVIDNHDNGTGSLNGANAAACAQDAGQFVPMHDLMYANQPDEKTDGFADKKALLALAAQVPALKANTAFTDCVNKGQHDGWVQSNADNFNKIGLQGTPTLFIDGTQVNFQQPQPDPNDTQQTYAPKLAAAQVQQLTALLDKEFAAKGGKAGTPVTLPALPSASTAPSAAGSSSAPSASGSSSAPSSAGSSSPSGTPSATKS